MPLFINVGGGGDYEVGGTIPATSLGAMKFGKQIENAVNINFNYDSFIGATEINGKVRLIFNPASTLRGVYYADLDRTSGEVTTGRLFEHVPYSSTTGRVFYRDRVMGGMPIALHFNQHSGQNDVLYLLNTDGALKQQIFIQKSVAVVLVDETHYVYFQSSPQKKIVQKRISDNSTVKEVILDSDWSYGGCMGVDDSLLYIRKQSSLGSYEKRIELRWFNLLSLNQVNSTVYTTGSGAPPGAHRWNVSVSPYSRRFIEFNKTAWYDTGTGGYSEFIRSYLDMMTSANATFQRITEYQYNRHGRSVSASPGRPKGIVGAASPYDWVYLYEKHHRDDSQSYRVVPYLARGDRYISTVISEQIDRSSPPQIWEKYSLPLMGAFYAKLPGTETTLALVSGDGELKNSSIPPGSKVGRFAAPGGISEYLDYGAGGYITEDGRTLVLISGSKPARALILDASPSYKILA